jgi:hypothetical protein
VFITRAKQQAELVVDENLLSSFSDSCFSVKIVYNYGFWWFEHLLKREVPGKKGLQSIL